ncbi:hypothetical protein OS187_13305 [Xanthomonadaceae bacterium JHOS43]|nr:hypothetical protein [Xanthomonadaceae bacterium JHOS43]
MKGIVIMEKGVLSSGLLALALLTGCVTTQPQAQPPAARTDWVTPEQAVFAAANAAPQGVPGTFFMRVRATGSQGGRFFLNSEQDYRDQRNLTVAMSATVVQQLAQRLGAEPLAALKDKDILLQGTAVRTKIYFLVNGRATEKYYYQTHVNVTDAAQITLVES